MLQLEDVDPKAGKYTLNVSTDDRTIEKKDCPPYEPQQFYTGPLRRLLSEIVVFSITSDSVAGYLSTPKVAQPAEVGRLRREADRNYFDFALRKGVPTTVSTITLQPKSVDSTTRKFTLTVSVDDRAIEKKDRALGEPLQFYTGRDRMLYEVVVLSIGSDSVTGYLSTPKLAPLPVTP